MKKSVITLLIFLIMIISVSAVSAADDASDLGASDDAKISVANTDTAVTADNNAKNFTDLSTDITAAGNIELSSDYKRNDGESVITVNRVGTIDGKGHVIDADGKGGIFIVNALEGTLTLKNMIFKNAAPIGSEDGGAIINHGTLVLDNVTFYNCVDKSDRAVNSDGDLTVNNCIFNVAGSTAHCGIITTGKLALSNNTYDNNNNEPFVTLNIGSSLTSECTIEVSASVDPTNFKKIIYDSSIVDDNNNWIYVENSVGTWNLTLNDIAAPTPIWADGKVKGITQAKSYGTQVVEITNTALVDADVVTASVDIAPKDLSSKLTLTVEPTNPVWNDNVNLTITVEAFYDDDLGYLYPSGDINITLTPGGKVPLTLNKTGVAKYVIENVVVGDYSILVEYGGDDFYKANYTNYQPAFTVNPKPIEPTVTVVQTTAGEQTINIGLPSDAAGYLTATVCNETFSEVVIPAKHITGSTSFNANLPRGNYNLTINFVSDGNYANYNDNVSFTVTKLTTNITITVENITYGNNVTFNITLDKGVANASVAVTTADPVPADFVTVALTNGSATVNKGIRDAGKYIITVKALDDNYEDCTTNTTFYIAKAVPEMTIVVGDVELFKPINVNVTVKDYAGNVDLDLLSGPGMYLYQGHATVIDGVAQFTIPADYNDVAGNFILNATFIPDDTFNIEIKDINKGITIDRVTPEIYVTLTAGKAEVYDDVGIDVVLSNYNTGYGPDDGAVVITLNGETVASTSVSDGFAQTTIPGNKLGALGKYTINVAYLGDNFNYNPNSTDFTFEVQKWDVELNIVDITNVTYGKKTTITVNVDAFYGDIGVPYTPENYTITIKNAKNETVKTISVALENSVDTDLNVTLDVGTYTAVLSYPGDDVTFANSTTSAEFNVTGFVKTLTIEILDEDYPNNATAVVTASVDGDYNITIDGVTKQYTVTVTGGTGSVTFDVLPAKDTYTATVKSIMELYPSNENTTTFAINKGTVVATLTIANVDYPEVGRAFVTANVDGKYEVRSESSLDKFFVDVVNGTGNATFTTPLSPGKYTLALWGVADNDNYTNVKVDEVAEFVVSKGTVDVNLTVNDTFYTNNTVVVLNVSVAGDYTIKLFDKNGVELNSTTQAIAKDTAVSITFENALVPETYTIGVTATIADYNDVKLNDTFVVNKGVIYYNIAVANITYDGSTIAHVTFTTSVQGSEATTKKGYAIYLGDATSPLAYINGNGTDNVVDLPLLGAGIYTVKVVPIDSDPAFKYYDLDTTPFNTTTFEVKKGTVSFDISANDVAYPDNVTVKIIGSTINATYIVSVGDVTQEVFVNTSDAFNVTFEGLPIDSYVVTVTSSNANYTDLTKTCDVLVTYGPVHPTVADVHVSYLEDTVLVVESDTDGVYIATVNEKDYTVNVVDGKGNVTLDVLPVGDYTVKLTAKIKDYLPYLNSTSARVYVSQAKVNLTIEVTNTTYPENATATVSANVSGTYTIKITGTTQEFNVTIETTPGVMVSVTQKLNMLGAGTYTATVDKAVLDGNFTVDAAQCEFAVAQAIPEILIDVLDTYSIYDNVTVVVTVPYGTGKVTISSDLLATAEVKDLVNETANITIAQVAQFGEHVITVELDDPNFIGGLKQVTFNVTKITPILNITFNNASYKEKANITVNIANDNTAIPNGLLIIEGIGSMPINSKDAFVFDLGDDLAAGLHILNITYTSDALYETTNVLFPITIAKITPVVNITNVTGGTYPDNATVTFTSNVAGDFIIYVIDANGIIVKSIPKDNVSAATPTTVNITDLDGGKYTANVTYVENENYTTVTTNSSEFVIIKGTNLINASIADVVYPNIATAVITSEQAGNYTIVVSKDAVIAYEISGSLDAGVNYVDLDVLSAGDYFFAVTYTSDNYTSEPVLGNFTVIKGAPIIAVVGVGATYPDTGVVNIMSSAAGDYTVTIGTFTTTGTFTAYELVTIDVPQLGAGEFDVVVDYAENANYNATTATGSFVIAKATPDIFIDVTTVLIGENATVIVTIDNATGIVTINGNNVELVDGSATYELGTLKAETYDITVVYGGDANFTVGNETLTFTVYKLPANLAISATNVTYGTSPVATITLDDKSDSIIRLYVNGREAIVEVKDGSLTRLLGYFAAGEYNFTAVYKGSDMYEADTVTTFFTVAKAEVHMTINASDVTYPNDAVVTVMSDVDGVYSVYVDPTGPSQNVTLKANVPQEVTFSGLAVGEHEACIEFTGNENYTDPMIEIAVFNVLAAPININIDVANATYPEDVVAYVSSDVAGKYTIAISGSATTQTIDVVAGEATKVVFAELDAGDYTITASYGDTENYTGTTKTADVTVAKADVHMTITADNVTYPATVYVTVSSDVAGDYSVYVDPWGIAQNITLAAGESRVVAFSGLEAGEHEVCIEYDGSKNYNEDIEFAVFNVLKALITVNIVAPDVTYPDAVVVTVTADVAGDYNFTFDGTTQTITLEANVAKVITESGLTAGTYDITVARAESDNYAAVTETASVTVAKSANTTMTIEATSPLAGENATVTVTLPADATGTVAVKYGNGVYTTDVVNGVATVSVPTNVAGTQTATIAYSGDNNYAPASDEVQITVKPNGIIIADNIKRGVNSPYDYYATLVDAYGNPVSGVEITFTIAGNTYKATTNASGIAVVSAGLGLVNDTDTKYDVIVTNPYTLENITGSTTIVPRLIVVSGDLTADYLENPPYIVQAIGDDGNPVGAGETVRVVFAGFYYDMLTNATGHVVRTIGLTPGMYAVKACYQGYNTTTNVFIVVQVMKVTSGTLKKTAKSYTLKATLKSSDGKALVGKEVKLTFNGKTYTVKTNSKGVASYTIKSSVISKLKAGKTYELKARYVNDIAKGKIKVVNK